MRKEPPPNVTPNPTTAHLPAATIYCYFLISRGLILMFGWLSLNVIREGLAFPAHKEPIDWLNKWDAGWYLSIAREGYHYDSTGGMSNVVFFPLYPSLMRLLAFVGLDLRIAGYLISNLALLGSALMIWKLVMRDTNNQRAALSAAGFLFIGPVSLFFSSIYTESLFLFLTVSSLYFCRGKQWFWSGICGYLAALTRAYGFLIAVPILWEFFQLRFSRPWIQPRGPSWKALYGVMPIFGLLTYAVFLWWQFGEPLAFQTAQAGWARALAPFWTGIENTFVQRALFYQVWLLSAWAIGLFLIGLGLCLKARPSYLIWTVLIFGLTVSSTTTESLPRYLSGLFPYYLILASITTRWPKTELPLMWASCMLLAFSAVLFFNGYWFT